MVSQEQTPLAHALGEALNRLLLAHMQCIGLAAPCPLGHWQAQGNRRTGPAAEMHPCDAVVTGQLGPDTADALAGEGAVYLVSPGRFTESPHAPGDLGLLLYGQWTGVRGEEPVYHPPDAPLPESAPGYRICMYVRDSYDPAAHARARLQMGKVESALEILENIPECLLTSDEARAVVASEKMLCILAWDGAVGEEGRTNRFGRVHHEFNKATTWAPRYAAPYHCHARFWERLGRPDMARRDLRTWAAASDEPLPEALPERGMGPCPMPPVWRGDYRPRILFLLHGDSDYGSDVLFDGLWQVLGAGQVREYPWKPTLHGQLPEVHANYPCMFNFPGEPMTRDALIAEIEAGHFDMVLYSDTLGSLCAEDVNPVVRAAEGLPFFVVDMWDQPGDYVAEIAQRCGAGRVWGHFKREYTGGLAYPEGAMPLPFSYDRARIPKEPRFDGRQGVFWAGAPQYGARRIKLEYLRDAMGLAIDQRYTQDEYVDALARCGVGISLFGNGFDTVRYWELAAHGCMLLAERPPIYIPHNFVEDEEAVFFGDLPELEEKLRHYLAHPGEAAAIAERGHRKLLEHHTGEARARQLLGWLERLVYDVE